VSPCGGEDELPCASWSSPLRKEGFPLLRHIPGRAALSVRGRRGALDVLLTDITMPE